MDMTPNAENRHGNPEAKPPKPFASLAQARRCDSLVADGTITREVFERDLLATDLENIPWRKGPAKEEDGTQAAQDEYRLALIIRKAGIEYDARAQDQIEGQERQEGFAGVEVLVLILICGMLLAGFYIVPAWQCHARAEKMGFGCEYGLLQGCMLKTKKGFIPLGNFRYMAE